jgi:hypothetical protein
MGVTATQQSLRQAANAFTPVIGKLLRNERLVWTFGHGRVLIEEFIDEIVFHGVECLVYERLDQLQDCPERLRAELQQRVLARAAWELLHRNLISQALAALAAAGIEALLFKGTALAYSLYENPACRTRADSDVLVGPEAASRAIEVLQDIGFVSEPHDEQVIYYQLDLSDSSGNHIDLHWRINNSELLSRVFTAAELQQRALPLPRLHVSARAVDSVDALIIACLHRGAHKKAPYHIAGRSEMTGDRLIWLYDIDQLVRYLPALKWREFIVRVQAKQLTGICRESLQRASAMFHTPLPSRWESMLADDRTSAPDRYFDAGAAHRLWLDFVACESWRDRLHYSSRLIFPPAGYMQRKYGRSGLLWLPWLYLRRGIEGIVSRIPRQRGDE